MPSIPPVEIVFSFFHQISHLSTCECLSNRNLYPTFFRTVPSDRFQIKALVELLKHFGWTWVGYIYGAEPYSEEGTEEFIRIAKQEGICTEYMMQFFGTASEKTMLATTIKSSTSKVVLAFMSLTFFQTFLGFTKEMNITGIQWVGSEAWISARQLANAGSVNVLQGAMGFAVTECYIPGLADFLLSLRPSDAPESIFTRTFWETAFGCSLSAPSSSADLKLCNGSEDLRSVANDYTDMSDRRTVYSVYKAVYAVAHAIHNLLQCDGGKNPTTGERCYNKSDVQPWRVRHGGTVQQNRTCVCLNKP